MSIEAIAGEEILDLQEVLHMRSMLVDVLVLAATATYDEIYFLTLGNPNRIVKKNCNGLLRDDICLKKIIVYWRSVISTEPSTIMLRTVYYYRRNRSDH